MGTATKAAASFEECRFLSKEEVLRLLHVSSTTLYALTIRKLNPLPSVKMGKSRRYPFDKVRGWMETLGK